MNRWRWAFLLVLLAALPIWLSRSSHPSMMADTDTVAILQGIEARQDPLSWFGGDWPLGNHFYRPITTLVFELDNALHPGSAAGFGATNALLAIACVIVLFWFLREFTDNVGMSAAASVLFAVWVAHPYLLGRPAEMLGVGIGAVALGVSLLPGRRPLLGLAGMFAAWYAAFEVGGLLQIRGGSLDWIPGRTATTMTIFALAAMAAYARFERLGAVRVQLAPTATDQPATKSSGVFVPPSRRSWVWAIVAILGIALALGSYEQAVMLPACLFGLAVAFRMRGWKVRWGWQMAFWAVLLGYFLLRRAVLPPGTSGYQLQQYRSSWDVLYTVIDYLFPAGRNLLVVANQLDLGFASLMLTQTPNVGRILAHAIAYGTSIRRPLPLLNQTALTAYLLSAIAFLPMAWLKQFPSYNHYHFWSLSLRSLFAVAMIGLTAQLLKRAVTPRAIQAPPRLVPAPGSLPRR